MSKVVSYIQEFARDAKTGRRVTLEYANKHKDTTVVEHRKVTYKTK